MEAEWNKCRNKQQYLSECSINKWRCSYSSDDIIHSMCKSNNGNVECNHDNCIINSYSISKHRSKCNNYLCRHQCYLYSNTNEWRYSILSMEAEWQQCWNKQQYISECSISEWRCGYNSD